MNAFIVVVWHEFRIQLRRPVVLGTFMTVSGLMLWEIFPNESNLARLSALPNAAYTAARLMNFSTPLFALLGVILSSGRVSWKQLPDQDVLLWTMPEMNGWIYLFGRYLGSVLVFSLLPAVLCGLGILERLIFLPDGFTDLPYLRAYLLLGMLPVAYIIALGFLVGAVVSLHFASTVLILYILWSMVLATPDNSGASPIFRLVGDLYFLVYRTPGHPANAGLQVSGRHSLLFEAGAILVGLFLLMTGLKISQKNRFHHITNRGNPWKRSGD